MNIAVRDDGIGCVADISDCGTYRYTLGRLWADDLEAVTWVMLNPSTASLTADDPTVRKCVGFAKTWGFGAIVIVNLFAFRSKDAKDLRLAMDVWGPENADALDRILVPGITKIAAWGGSIPNKPWADEAARRIRDLARHQHGEWSCLGRTKAGEPRHPLMLAYSTPREPWPAL